MKKGMNKLLSITILIFMFFSLVIDTKPYVVLADENNNALIKEALLQKIQLNVQNTDTFSRVKKLNKDNENSNLKEEGNPEERVRIIVELEEKPATIKFENSEEISEDLINEVKEAQKPIQDEVKEKTGEDIRHTYGNLINGFSMDVKRKDIEKVKSVDGVNKVSEARIYYPDMTTAKEFTQTLNVWKDYGYKGEGLVISIIDTGIDYTHKDMKISDISKIKIDESAINEENGKYYTEKVPYGYNFADEDNEIIDTSGSMHGMHVAGIVAANANEEDINNNNGTQGVAPEAQLLAMKVFSNNSEIKGAYSDDIIAAIEESVKLDADIINMSLGSVSGYRDEEDPEQVAIKNATDDGVICVVSAGNSTTSTNPYMIDGISDIATVGSPGIAEDALQVASSENSQIVLTALTATIDGKDEIVGYTECDINPLDKFSPDEKLKLVDCGLGRIEDYKDKDLQGKIALVKRGDITFIDKQINAQNAGASAVIIYNKDNTGYINMASDPSIEIPAIFINGDHGNLLIEKINNATISFENKTASIPNASSSEMSEFTSWGPAPNLDFAPQITGPGGNIYSTLNNNRYGSMSGTSMAAPHVAGATALIIEGLKDKGINLEGRELVEFVKKSIINTAEPLMENTLLGDTLPYSPRRQGAGMIQAKSAIDNRVIAVGEDNEATISLKEISDKTEFEITLKNYSNKSESYRIESLGDVLTSIEPSMFGEEFINIVPFDIKLDGATLTFNNELLEVPANGEVKVKATLKVPSGVVTNNFIEGFIKFVAITNETPSLVVPYMGYYGDWGDESIIDGEAWEPNEVKISPSFAAAEILGEYSYLGALGRDDDGNIIIDPEKIAISPNEDSIFDSFVPALYLLRNAKEVKVDLLDKDKNVIQANINGDKDFRKKIFSSEGGDNASIYSSLSWNGKIYNKSTGKDEVAKEGQYYLNYKAKVDGEETYQSYIIPTKIDITPVISKLESSKETSSTDYDLQLSFNGELKNNNVQSTMLYINNKEITNYNISEDILSAKLSLNNDSINKIEIATIDNAGNIGIDKYEIGVGKYKAEVKLIDFPEGDNLNNNELLIKGEYIGDVAKILINNDEPDSMVDGVFYKLIRLNEGYNTIKVYAVASNGNVVINQAHKVFCDTIAPIISINEPIVGEDGVAITSKDSIKLKGSISDNTEGYKLFINGENKLNIALDGAKGESDTYREFEYDIPVVDKDIITIRAVDLSGNETSKQITVKVDKTIPEIILEEVENNRSYNKNLKPTISVNPEGAKITATLNGNPYNFEEITSEGDYKLEVKALGRNGIESSKTIEFSIDKTAPIINIDGVIEGKYYNTDVIPNVTSEKEVSLSLELNEESYNNTKIIEEGKYSLKIKAIDKAGNITDKELKFVIDKTAPIITIDGLVSGMKYDKEVTPIINSNEEGELIVTLNDKAYNGEKIKDNGKYILKVLAKDLAGNITEISRNFEVKLPEKDINKPNPIPVPNPKPNTNNDQKENDDNINKEPIKELDSSEKLNLPKTGDEKSYSLLITSLLLIGVGGILFKRKIS